MNILIIGQVTLHWGRMEFGNIGNYYILEPFIRELHLVFPDAIIKTTLQLSERFCQDEKVEVLPMDLYYSFNGEDLDKAKKEIMSVENYVRTGILSERTRYIEEVLNSDFVIDFSGDIWGENANFLGKDRFEVGLYKNLIAQRLGKPTFLLAGSPGPFSEETLSLAKDVFKNFTLVTNREPISSILLRQAGFDTANVEDLACPSFLFAGDTLENAEKILLTDGIISKEKPVIGFILCGWNFSNGPFDRWPREDSDYLVFAKAIEYINTSIGAQVVLMSHANGFPVPPKAFQLMHGRDYPIIKQLQKVVAQRGIAKDVTALDGIYDPFLTKAIIGNFDMLISGRVHAAVAGLSQSVPTVVMDYGHEPRAHKLRGFARLIGVEEYLCNPDNEKDVIDKIQKCWQRRTMIREQLDHKIPSIKEQARRNFSQLKEALKHRGIC